MRNAALVFLMLMMCAPAFAGDAVEPGKLVVERSTLHCLGFEWPIAGDDNRNATVTVQYRAQGEQTWREALPLLRIGGENVAGVAGWAPYVVPHGFAGSIFDLQPGTTYEVNLRMTDPDGGESNQLVRVATKATPTLFDGRKVNVSTADELRAAFKASQPGDRIILAPGVYKGQFDFTNHSGEPGKPIALIGRDGAMIEGAQTEWVIKITGSDHLWFENITFRDPDNGDGGHTKEGVVILAGNHGHDYVPGAASLIVRHCTFEDFGVGIMAVARGCVDYTITDNTFNGRQDWLAPKESPTDDYTTYSYVAAWVSGAGTDVAYNYVRGFRDGINVASLVPKDGDKSTGPRAISVYNNIITQMGDDFGEADNGVHNIRFMRNLCLNTQTCGLSAQPVYGGPVYFIGNILYNGPRGIALKPNVQPAGLIVYHNTFAIPNKNGAKWSNGHFRNNIFMTRSRFNSLTDTSTADYNGYLPGDDISFHQPSGHAGGADVGALHELGHELHGRMLPDGLGTFVNVPEPPGKDRAVKFDEVDFTLVEGSPAVDAGVVLPNINDDFVGGAPDLGALERGGKKVHFGPRPKGASD